MFGRWGNFMNREAHGGETTNFLRMGLVGSDGVIRYYHPTFLYESLWNLVGLVLMHRLAKKRKFDGQIMLTYFLWYGLGRAWIEGLRTDSLYLFNTGIRVSQLLALIFVIISLAILFYVFHAKKPDGKALYICRANAAAEAAREEPAAEESATADEGPEESSEEESNEEESNEETAEESE